MSTLRGGRHPGPPGLPGTALERYLDLGVLREVELIDCLNLLVARKQVEVHWLTSWDLDAPLCAAPAIGLHAGHLVARDGDEEDGKWWKLMVIREFAGASDFYVWTDDYIDTETSTAIVKAVTDGKALAVCPDPERGLSPEI